MATVFDVAQRAGVSATTVSRVLLGRNIVTPEKRARVLEAAAALGYQPNPMAQGLRMGRGHSVALLVGDIEQNIYSALTKHVQTALEAIGLELLLFDLGHRADRLRSLLERAAALRLRGICIATSDVVPARELKPLLRGLAEKNIPVLALNQRLDGAGIPSVTHDDEVGTARAVTHLIRSGRAPVAYLGRIKHSATGQVRFRGYQMALAEAGIAADPALVWESERRYRYEAGYEEMSQALDRGIKVRAVFGASDELALGAMAAALDRGLRVPDDIAFVGFGGISWGAHVRPALTTIAGDWAEFGKRVSEIFLALDEGRPAPRRSVIETRLIERQSTGNAG